MTYVQPACFSGTWLQVTGAMMIFIAPKLHLRKLGACDGGDMVKRGWGYGLDLSNHSRMQSWNLWRFIGKWDFPQNFRCIKIVFFFHVIWVVACGGEIDSCIRGWTVDLKGMWYLWVHHWWVRSKGIPLIWVTVLFAPEVTKKGIYLFFSPVRLCFWTMAVLGNLLAHRLCCLALPPAHQLHLALHFPWSSTSPRGHLQGGKFGTFMGLLRGCLHGLPWPFNFGQNRLCSRAS